MKIQFIFTLSLVFMSLMFMACGSGGSSNQFEGLWTGRLELVEDEPEGCENDFSLDAEHDVRVDDSGITVFLQSGGWLEGMQLSENSFEATISIVSAFASIVSSVTYEEVADSMANVTFVLSNSSFSPESGSQGCRAQWIGVMTRS